MMFLFFFFVVLGCYVGYYDDCNMHISLQWNNGILRREFFLHTMQLGRENRASYA